MSTTRIIFIAVCIVLGALVLTLGVIIQRNDPDSKYSLSNALKPLTPGHRRKSIRLPKNPNAFISIFLILLLLFLFLVFSRK